MPPGRRGSWPSPSRTDPGRDRRTRKNPLCIRIGGSFVLAGGAGLEAARNPLDVAAAQTDIVQLAIRQAVQFTTGHAGIVPRAQHREEVRSDFANAPNSMAAVQFHRRHFHHLFQKCPTIGHSLHAAGYRLGTSLRVAADRARRLCADCRLEKPQNDRNVAFAPWNAALQQSFLTNPLTPPATMQVPLRQPYRRAGFAVPG